ncbi:hypothetical protein Y032_0023g666 [Ancylostoma ceylanicum]|uniref:Uncharacterized protein n=1 Tax=Ancylostoma ceylanicum TaxID=53326 RepID=A0A016UWX0_9BILA|nr:hypothetical protein Y032_0023g666 [Ancylostoma ceylanicum]
MMTVQSVRFDSAFAVTVAPLALDHAARSSFELNADRCCVFVVTVRKQTRKLTEDIGLIMGQLFDLPRYVPRCQQSRCHDKHTAGTNRLSMLHLAASEHW